MFLKLKFLNYYHNLLICLAQSLYLTLEHPLLASNLSNYYQSVGPMAILQDQFRYQFIKWSVNQQLILALLNNYR